jgi:lipoprotein-releasing system permease protein
MDVMTIVITAILISLLATLYPSWRASKLDPAEALRYE